jgi:hypothetical protein
MLLSLFLVASSFMKMDEQTVKRLGINTEGFEYK